MLGIVALLGLLLQKKTFSETISGTIKTMVGVLVLFAGVDILVNVITPISTLFSNIYTFEGEAITADWVGFLSTYGAEIVLIMVFGFLVNLLLARFTKLKFVFLTGHILFWNAFMVTASLADGGKISGVSSCPGRQVRIPTHGFKGLHHWSHDDHTRFYRCMGWQAGW
jgi:PTS system ascorbate-specific IIC component